MSVITSSVNKKARRNLFMFLLISFRIWHFYKLNVNRKNKIDPVTYLQRIASSFMLSSSYIILTFVCDITSKIKMSCTKALLNYAKDKNQIINSLSEINHNVIDTFKECCDACFAENAAPNAHFRLKIDSVVDYLHEELHTGHWSDVPPSIKTGFTAANFVKAVIILGGDVKAPANLTDAVKCLDMGILLGAPLPDNENLLTDSAKYVTKQLRSMKDEVTSKADVVEPKGLKRKRSDSKYDGVEGIEVDRKSVPSLEHFQKNYLIPEKPVVIEGCLSHWPACEKWIDVNYLLEVAGERTVPVEIGSQYSDENWSQKLMKLRVFIEKYYLEKNSEIGYLAQHNLLDQIPELRKDVSIPEYCCISRDFSNSDCSLEPEINAWFGPKGTVSSMHYDPKDNLLAQVFGTKFIVLFSPSDSDYLYVHDSPLLSNTAQVDPVSPDLVSFPRFKEATPYKCFLNAGDMLYIPPKWWHHVTALEKSFSINFWWS